MVSRRSYDNEPHPALIGLLRWLPHEREGLTATEKQRFMETFRAVLDYVYPTKEEPPANSAAG